MPYLPSLPDNAVLVDSPTSTPPPVGERMRPVLRYVGKLTLIPSRMTDADADLVVEVG